MFDTIVLFIVVPGLYLLPSIIAYRRKHARGGPIMLVNLLFGWSIIGWIVAFIWAISDPPEKQATS
jgi:hypothetical protein